MDEESLKLYILSQNYVLELKRQDMTSDQAQEHKKH